MFWNTKYAYPLVISMGEQHVLEYEQQWLWLPSICEQRVLNGNCQCHVDCPCTNIWWEYPWHNQVKPFMNTNHIPILLFLSFPHCSEKRINKWELFFTLFAFMSDFCCGDYWNGGLRRALKNMRVGECFGCFSYSSQQTDIEIKSSVL
jgi:hypothetical protein